MKLTASTLKDEFDKMLVMRPIFKANSVKEALVQEDWERITEHWEEEAFKSACFEVRKPGGSFPSIKEIEQAYWQAVKDQSGQASEQDDLEKDHRRRMREHNELWSQVSSSSDLPWIMEQATDEIDAALEKMGTPQPGSAMTESGISWIIDKIRKNRETAIRGRACEIWKESRE